MLRLLGFAQSAWPLYTEFVYSNTVREGIRQAAWHSTVQAALIRPVRWLSDTFLFRPHFYFALALALLPVALIRRQRDAAVLLASGLLYELTLMFVAIRAEYRDSHWLIAATVLAIIMVVARGLEARHERVDDQAAVGVARDDHV